MQNSAGETVNFVVTMEPIAPAESGAFLKMAESHFRELDSSFVPRQDWGKNYFTIIQSNPHFYLRWIAVNDARAGFILFGLEDHNFLANTSGWIYELYVLPEFRRKGVARESALRAILELQAHTSKIQLEIMEGNQGAKALWKSLGFGKFCERWVKRDEPK